MEAAAIVLAAGAGTRMKSKKPKVAHEVLGKPLVRWVVDAAHEAGIGRIATVVGHERQQVEPLVEADTEVVVQPERRGTADAVAVCADALADFDGSLVVLSGDCPLITAATIRRLVNMREQADAAVVVLTMELENPYGYGRIVRDRVGAVERIVEQKMRTAPRPPSASATPASTASTPARCSRRFRRWTTTTPRASSTSPTCWPSAAPPGAPCWRFPPTTRPSAWA